MSPNIFKRSHFLIFTRNTPDRPCPSAHFHLSRVREKQCVCSYYNYLMCMYIITQSCLTLCDPTDCSPPGSSVHGILQARILEWAAISYYRGSSHPGIKPQSPTLQADSLLSEPPGKSFSYILIKKKKKC